MTQDELKARLHYDPETGVFTWKERADGYARSAYWNSAYAGKPAGCINKVGYLKLVINDKQYLGHRMAFLYMTGRMPEEVDHINGVRSDNRWANLRPANRSVNMKNLSRNSANTSGKTGICWDKNRGKWLAYINAGGKRLHNKRFSDREDAERQRDKWSKEYAFHENHGRN